MLQKQAVSDTCLQLIKDLISIPALSDFRLVGGTALALQYGHRRSIDIDLFSDKAFNNEQIIQALEAYLYPTRIENPRKYPFGFFCDLREIKCDFMFWGHTFEDSPIVDEGIKMASATEILAMKLQATTSRRTKKDFFDIAYLSETITLKSAIEVFEKKYPEYDSAAVIKQLTAFEEVENTPEPEMLIPLKWELAKEKISTAVKNYWESSL
jgi:Nucleotidyl transferase AbiEii toxin, Type IV TA system